MSKAGDLTPRLEPVVDHAVEIEVVESISRIEAVEPLNDDHIVGPSKKNKKRDRSCRRSHSSSWRHCHAQGSPSQPLPDSIFVATTRFSKFIQTTVDEPSYIMLKASDAPSLTDSITELSSRTLLIGKMMKEKSASDISYAEFEKMKNELVEANEKINSLTFKVKEINVLNIQRETKKENLKNKIAELNAEKLQSGEEKAQIQK